MHLLIPYSKRLGFIAVLALVAVSSSLITRTIGSNTPNERVDAAVDISPMSSEPVTANWIRPTTVTNTADFFFRVEFSRGSEPVGVGDVKPEDFENLGSLESCVFSPSKAQLAERQSLRTLRAVDNPMADYPTVYNVMVSCAGTGSFIPAFTDSATVAVPPEDVEVLNEPAMDQRTINVVSGPILVVSKTGGGYVSSTTSSFQCGEICSDTTPLNKSVQLRALAYPGMVFVGWSGSCSGTGLCSLRMSKSQWVGALFEPAGGILLEKIGTGNGSVTSKPAGVSCPETTSSCATWHRDGTLITLTATATAKSTDKVVASTFVGWAGACFGNGTCTVLIDSDSDPIPVYAIFKRK